MKDKIFQIKDSNTHIEQAKYNVTRNLFSFLALLLGGLFIMNFIQGDINMYAVGFGAIFCVLVLFIQYKTKKYKVAAISAVFMALALNQSNLLIASNFNNFLDFFWIVIFALYVFFTLGKYWGVTNLYVNVIGIVIIFAGEKMGYVELIPKEFTTFSLVNFIINATFATFVFCYIILQMIKQMRMAAEKHSLANKELVLRNEEKTVMLKEIHHRVKNNLQVITSLLRLQLDEVKDENTQHHFNDSINRVSAMAIIHEKMYQTESLSQIDLESYLESLIEDLITSYSGDIKISTSVNSNIKDIDPKSIVPLALIFNELISNSIEHAFDGKSEGNIDIKVEKNTKGETFIHYVDNGNWKEPAKKKSFGTELIQSFTEQLDGSYLKEIDSEGTHFKFLFKESL